MKSFSRLAILRLVFWAMVAGAAFWIGAQQRKILNLNDTLASASTNSTNGPAPNNLGGPNSPQALAQLQMALDKKLNEQRAVGTQQLSKTDALVKLIKEDATSGLAELAKLPPGPETQAMYNEIFMRLAMDPDFASTAASLAAGLPVGPNRLAALQAVIQGWGRSNPQDMLAWASQLPPENAVLFKNALLDIAKNPNQTDLAIEYLDKLTDPTAHIQLLDAITTTLSRRDPVAALQWLGTMVGGKGYAGIANPILSRMTVLQPAMAAVWLENESNPTVRSITLDRLASRWGQKDPQSAIQWAQTLQGKEGSTAMNTILTGWAKSDAPSALAYIKSTDNPSAFLSAIPGVAQSLAATDPQAALALVQELPDGTAKNKTLVSTVVGAAQSNLPEALSFAAGLPAGPTRDAALVGIVDDVTQQSPAKAAALIAQLPAGDAQAKAAGDVAAAWVNANPAAFTQWLGGLGEGDVRDAAIVQLDTSVQAGKQPAAVFAQANSITNPDLRAAQVQLVLTNWAATDPAAALAAAQNAKVTSDQRASLIQTLSRNPAAQ